MVNIVGRGTTSSLDGLYPLGYTHVTMVKTGGSELVKVSKANKLNLSSECRL